MADSQEADAITASVPFADSSTGEATAKPLIPTAVPLGEGEQPAPTPLEPPSATIFPPPSEPVPVDLAPAPQGEVSLAARVHPETGSLEFLKGAVDGEPPFQLAGTTITFETLRDFELAIFKLNANLAVGQDVRDLLPAELLDSVLVLPDGVPLAEFLAAEAVPDIADDEGRDAGPSNGFADGTSQTIIIGEEVADSANSPAGNLLRDQPVASDLPQRVIDRSADGPAPGGARTEIEDAGRVAAPPAGIVDGTSQTIANGEPILDEANAPTDNLFRDQPIDSDLPQRIIDRRADGAAPGDTGTETDDGGSATAPADGISDGISRTVATGEGIRDGTSAPADNLLRDRPNDDSLQAADSRGVEEGLNANQGAPLSEVLNDLGRQPGAGDTVRTPPESDSGSHADVPATFEEAPQPATGTPLGPVQADDRVATLDGSEFSGVPDPVEASELPEVAPPLGESLETPLRKDDLVLAPDAGLVADAAAGPAAEPGALFEPNSQSVRGLPDASPVAVAPPHSQSLDPFDAAPATSPTGYTPGVDFVALATANHVLEPVPVPASSLVATSDSSAGLFDGATPFSGDGPDSPNVLERVLDYVRETVLGADEPEAALAESALATDCDDDTLND